MGDLDLPVVPRPLDGDVLPAELHLRALCHPGGDGGVRPGEGAHPAELPLRLPAGDHRKAGAHRPEAVVPVPVSQGDGGEGRDGQTRRKELPHVGGRVSAVDEERTPLPRRDAQNGPIPRRYRVRVSDPLCQLMDGHKQTSLKFLLRQRTTAAGACQGAQFTCTVVSPARDRSPFPCFHAQKAPRPSGRGAFCGGSHKRG